jgi:hypothetical protein
MIPKESGEMVELIECDYCDKLQYPESLHRFTYHSKWVNGMVSAGICQACAKHYGKI